MSCQGSKLSRKQADQFTPILYGFLFHKIPSVTSMSQWFLSYSLNCCCFISAYCLHNYLSLYGNWQSLQSASKRFPSLGPPANGNKSNAKNSWFRPNRNFTGTMYHWTVILRSFSVVLNLAKRNANGFFKVLLLSSHLLISRYPVRKSKFGACAVTGYCPF